MANDAQYMPLYVGQYLADTSHLPTIAHGAYMLLIMNYWQRGKPLPDNDRKLAAIARMPIDEWADIREDLEEFFDVEDGLWTHKRIDAELTKVQQKIEAARRAGQASARSRSNGSNTSVQRPSNTRSTDAERALNERSTIRKGKEDKEESSSLRSEDARAKKPKDIDGFRAVMGEHIGADAVEAFIKHRRSKRGAITEYAARLFVGNMEKCGLSVAEGVDLCISRNWITVEPGWLERDQKRGGTAKETRAAKLSRWVNGGDDEQTGESGSGGNVEFLPPKRAAGR